ncbi:MAG: hypothetical protein IKM11_02745 [Oscillospiraceae bacterium]|nr:hypothetical protein [Oscillospiraceae bacterium]
MRRKLFLFILTVALLSLALFFVLTLILGAEYLVPCALVSGLSAAYLANFLSNRFVRSLADLDPHRPDALKTYEELTPLLRRLQTQSETIRVQKETIAHHQEDRETLRREFSATVSHELKTPLTSISGFAELLKSGTVPPETAAEFAEDIYNEAQRMITLVEDIMHLSRLDENSVPMEHTEVDLHALAARVTQRLSAAAQKAGVALTLKGSRVTINGVELLLDEIIFNLTDNAIKYNRPGGSVTVTTGRQFGRVFLTVQDTGIGIPEEHLARVFERFYRVDKSHSKEVGGTGLGLSIVKHAAAYHDAAVSIDSTEGKGTTVTVRFSS